MLIGTNIKESLDQQELKPLRNNVIVKRLPKSEYVGSSILLSADSSYIMNQWAIVLAIPNQVRVRSTDKLSKPMLEVGDKVFVRSVDGDRFLPFDQDYEICPYNEIEAVERDGVIYPTHGRLIVLMTKAEQKTAGGLYLPDTVLNPLIQVRDTGMGVVKKVNADTKEGVLPGQYVHYVKDNSPRYEVGEDTYFIVNENDILLVEDVS